MGPRPPTIALESSGAREVLRALEHLHPLMLATDRQMQILWMSEKCRQLTRNPDEHLGESVADFFAALSDSGKQLRASEPFGSVLSHYETNSSATRTCLDLGAPEGSPRLMRVNLLRTPGTAETATTVAILDLDGSSPETVSTPSGGEMDIRAMLEFHPDAGFAVDTAGTIIHFNKAASALFELEESQAHDRTLPLIADRSKELAAALASLPETEEQAFREIEIVRPLAGRTWISLVIRPLSPSSHTRASHIAFAREIGRYVRDRKDLERRTRDLGDSLREISHDLRSPLVSLLGFAQLLRRDYGPVLDENGRRFAERIEQGARTMNSLIDDALDVSRQYQKRDPGAVEDDH